MLFDASLRPQAWPLSRPHIWYVLEAAHSTQFGFWGLIWWMRWFLNLEKLINQTALTIWSCALIACNIQGGHNSYLKKRVCFANILWFIFATYKVDHSLSSTYYVLHKPLLNFFLSSLCSVWLVNHLKHLSAHPCTVRPWILPPSYLGHTVVVQERTQRGVLAACLCVV